MDFLESVKAWKDIEPGRLIGRGHPAGDLLEAYQWQVLEERRGYLKIDAHLPDQVKNPLGQLFGGFTPTYVDLAAVFTVYAGQDRGAILKGWLATTNMRIDYFEPIQGPRFLIESRLMNRRGRMCYVETRFIGGGGELMAFGLTTMRELDLETVGQSAAD
jgi:acyl-coenzyme A thioesterase PaaI-like protein